MSLDFKLADQSSSEGVSLSFSDYQKLEPSLNRLNAITGVTIDPYKNTRVHPQHSRVLQESIDMLCATGSDEIKRLSLLLAKAYLENLWIVAQGD